MGTTKSEVDASKGIVGSRVELARLVILLRAMTGEIGAQAMEEDEGQRWASAAVPSSCKGERPDTRP